MLARAHRARFMAVTFIAAVAAALAVLASGCGSTSLLIRTSTAAAPKLTRQAPKNGTLSAPPSTVPLTPPPGLGGRGGTITIPDPGPTGIHAAASAVGVIRAWSDALRRGDLRSAARYFALPSVMINGTDSSGAALVITINTRTQAVAANASLPCGARLISADQRGRYVNALFRLTGRPGLGGSDCGTGAGDTARTNFVIAHGMIIEWIRAPDDPGDNGGSTAPAPAPAPPTQLPPSQPTV